MLIAVNQLIKTLIEQHGIFSVLPVKLFTGSLQYNLSLFQGEFFAFLSDNQTFLVILLQVLKQLRVGGIRTKVYLGGYNRFRID